ncbi:hypothetical protein ACTQ1U_15465 [Thermoguttaceae bacterium LCP21S3_D4]
MMPDVARPDKADNVKKKVSPLLDYGNTFRSLLAYSRTAKMGIESSKTAIRECLRNLKAFMRASALIGLKWQ